VPPTVEKSGVSPPRPSSFPPGAMASCSTAAHPILCGFTIMRNPRYLRLRRRTKIVCTLGPASGSATAIRRLILAGMNVARINLSHGSDTEHAQHIQTVRRLAERLGIPVAILIDLPGPKYRTGNIAGGSTVLRKGAHVTLTTRQGEGTSKLIPVNFPTLPQDVKVGDTVVIADGAIQLKVQEVSDTDVRCRIVVGGLLTPGRGIVVPGMTSSRPFMTDDLREDIEFATAQGPDYVALSFVETARDVEEAKGILKRAGAEIPVISKIERRQAVANFDELLAVSDGIMVARGDLGVDIPVQKVPLVQKEIIEKCNRAGKPVITATQMLESMIDMATPTRAEAADVANAVLDGTDAVMLSAETAIGKHPVDVVKTMSRIASEAETAIPYEDILHEKRNEALPEVDDAAARAACQIAHQTGARAIATFTTGGSTSLRVSKYRPKQPIVAVTPSDKVVERLCLVWGVRPVKRPEPVSLEQVFEQATEVVMEMRVARRGDLIIITAGLPLAVPGSTNLVKIHTVGEKEIEAS